MHWSIPQIPTVEERFPPLKARYFGMALAFLYLPALWGIWLLWQNGSHWLLLLSTAAAPLLLCGIVWVGYLLNDFYGAKVWLKQSAEIHQSWKDWAERHIGVLAADVLLPSEIAELSESQLGSAFGLSAEQYRDLPQQIDSFIQNLLDLAEKYRLEKVTVYLDASLDKTDDLAIIDLLEQTAAKVIESSKTAVETVYCEIHVETLDAWLQTPPHSLFAVLSPALNNEDEEPSFTENITWLIFADPAWAEQKDLPVQACIERPIDVDLTQKDTALSALQLFKRYGLAERNAVALWSALPQEHTVIMNGLLPQADITLPYADNPVRLLQNNIGSLPPNAAWLAFALAVQRGNRQEPKLLAWNRENGKESSLAVIS